MAWFVPTTGLAGAVTTERIFSSFLVGLLVSTVMSVPLSALQAEVAKTATAKRVAEAVWSAAAVAASFALLGIDRRSLFSAAIGLTLVWIVLAVSAAMSPLRIAATKIERQSIAWLPLPQRSPLASIGKRIFDVAISTVALVVIAPLLAVVAIAIKAHDGGPVLFRQRRVGKNGTTFEMIKFRSMVLDAEERKAELEASSDRSGPLFKMSNDPRITPIGRIIRELSIDELPQLLNIMRGDMSLVGPRPALPNEAAQFDRTLQKRDLVTPGLTGLWQAEARSDADFERFRSLDLRYVSSASPALDFWIILATATEIVASAAAVPLAAAGFDVASTDGIDLRESDDVVIDLRDSSHNPEPRPTAA